MGRGSFEHREERSEGFRGRVIGSTRQFNHRALAELPPYPEASPTFTLGFRVVRSVCAHFLSFAESHSLGSHSFPRMFVILRSFVKRRASSRTSIDVSTNRRERHFRYTFLLHRPCSTIGQIFLLYVVPLITLPTKQENVLFFIFLLLFFYYFSQIPDVLIRLYFQNRYLFLFVKIICVNFHLFSLK